MPWESRTGGPKSFAIKKKSHVKAQLHAAMLHTCDWVFPKLLRCMDISCIAMRCKFQHVGNFAPNVRVYQLFIVQLQSGFQHNDRHSLSFHVIWYSIFLAKYFNMLSLRWKLQERMETLHREWQTGHTVGDT